MLPDKYKNYYFIKIIILKEKKCVKGIIAKRKLNSNKTIRKVKIKKI